MGICPCYIWLSLASVEMNTSIIQFFNFIPYLLDGPPAIFIIGGFIIIVILPVIAIILLIVYFIVLRKQKRKRAEAENQINNQL